MLHSKFDKYVIHLEGHVHPMAMVGTLVYDEDTSPLLQPSPRSKKVYVADLSNDLYGVWIGTLTHSAPYTPLYEGKTAIEVRTDDGKVLLMGKQWFKEVYFYDEDESRLTCRDIEFQEGDYIDLRKHTPEQIRHIAEYYEFCDLKHLLYTLEDHPFIYWDDFVCEFTGIDDISGLSCEYTYDDIFYLEEV